MVRFFSWMNWLIFFSLHLEERSFLQFSFSLSSDKLSLACWGVKFFSFFRYPASMYSLGFKPRFIHSLVSSLLNLWSNQHFLCLGRVKSLWISAQISFSNSAVAWASLQSGLSSVSYQNLSKLSDKYSQPPLISVLKICNSCKLFKSLKGSRLPSK